ncbi:EcsC family protein [Azospirillum sp. sgz302134]
MPEGALVSRQTNACALLSPAEYDTLVQAAREYLAAQGALMTLMSTLGSTIEKGIATLPDGIKDEIMTKVREALEYAQRVSLTGMDKDVGREASKGLYGLAAAAAGGVSGFFGLPAILVELPATTVTILRAIADVARSKGADLDDAGVQATCIETFAYGGPLDDDDDADLAFFAARVGATELAEVVAKVAVRYAGVVLPKVALQAVPITGAVLGAGLNWSYMRFYQAMASVLFTLRPIELTHDRDQVRSCFSSIVRELRQQEANVSRAS